MLNVIISIRMKEENSMILISTRYQLYWCPEAIRIFLPYPQSINFNVEKETYIALGTMPVCAIATVSLLMIFYPPASWIHQQWRWWFQKKRWSSWRKSAIGKALKEEVLFAGSHEGAPPDIWSAGIIVGLPKYLFHKGGRITEKTIRQNMNCLYGFVVFFT